MPEYAEAIIASIIVLLLFLVIADWATNSPEYRRARRDKYFPRGIDWELEAAKLDAKETAMLVNMGALDREEAYAGLFYKGGKYFAPETPWYFPRHFELMHEFDRNVNWR